MSSERWLVYKAAAFEIKQCVGGVVLTTSRQLNPGTFMVEDS
jgi:hypothetical protein